MDKRCFRCGEKKSLSEFYRHAMMADGHLNKCKECTKRDEHSRRHGEAREKVLSYDRERASRPNRRAAMLATVSEWSHKHPDRRRAQTAVGNAIRAKKLSPLPCLICGAKAEAHHPDYSDPLYPVWLCPSHHKQAHALARQPQTEKNHDRSSL